MNDQVKPIALSQITVLGAETPSTTTVADVADVTGTTTATVAESALSAGFEITEIDFAEAEVAVAATLPENVIHVIKKASDSFSHLNSIELTPALESTVTSAQFLANMQNLVDTSSAKAKYVAKLREAIPLQADERIFLLRLEMSAAEIANEEARLKQIVGNDDYTVAAITTLGEEGSRRTRSILKDKLKAILAEVKYDEAISEAVNVVVPAFTQAGLASPVDTTTSTEVVVAEVVNTNVEVSGEVVMEHPEFKISGKPGQYLLHIMDNGLRSDLYYHTNYGDNFVSRNTIYSEEDNPQLTDTQKKLTDKKCIYQFSSAAHVIGELEADYFNESNMKSDSWNSSFELKERFVKTYRAVEALQLEGFKEAFDNGVVTVDGFISFLNAKGRDPKQEGEILVFEVNGRLQALQVTGAEAHVSMFRRQVILTGIAYFATETGLQKTGYTKSLPHWSGEISLEELGLTRLSKNPDLYQELLERGQHYIQITDGVKYMQYKGTMSVAGYWGPVYFAATGRVVIDFEGMTKLNPNYHGYHLNHVSDNPRKIGSTGGVLDSLRSKVEGLRANKALIAKAVSNELTIPTSNPIQEAVSSEVTVEDEEALEAKAQAEKEAKEFEVALILTSPFVYGYSMVAKRWGQFDLDAISDINFRSDAYEKLVLDKETKDLMFALVSNASNPTYSNSDLIDNKGGGCIFLLSGPPGVGKTLSAESIAEKQQRPLYIASVGELGTDAQELESNLQRILDIVSRWDAVLLLDEADIFLEARTDLDIHRNAMVGVFLRTLEYFSGILFLTTNRASNLDEAFFSRISLAICYDNLAVEARDQIWKNLTVPSEHEVLDFGTLSSYNVNGRQIKNSIRNARALAAYQGRQELGNSDIFRVLNKVQEFNDTIKKSRAAHGKNESILVSDVVFTESKPSDVDFTVQPTNGTTKVNFISKVKKALS